MEVVNIGDTELRYKIVRSSRKTLGITIHPEEGVVIRSPESLGKKQIESIVRKKANWILDKLEKLKDIKPKPASRQFIKGEKLPYLGRYYDINIKNNPGIKGVKVNLYQGKFIIEIGYDVPKKK